MFWFDYLHDPYTSPLFGFVLGLGHPGLHDLISRSYLRAGEIAAFIEYLLDRHKSIRAMPRNYAKKIIITWVWSHACSPSVGRQRQVEHGIL